MTAQLIVNAQVVNEGSISTCDLLIREGRIEKIAPQIQVDSAIPVLDAQGRY